MPRSRNIYLTILQSPRTVFNIPSLMALSGNYDRASLVKSLYYYRKKGLLISPRSGLYAKPGYNPLELAGSIFSNSYVSLQTVLAQAGVVFQYSDRITLVCELSRELIVDGKTFLYRRIKPELWGAMNGILQKPGYFIATPERALLDTMYLYPDIRYFDNPSKLDFERIAELSTEYKNANFEKRVFSWIKTSTCSL